MPREAKRKFVGLKCLEVSLVDEPANERPIAVMKRRTQENDMANKTKPVTKSTEGAQTTETVQAAVPAGVTPEQFSQLLDIAKSLGATAVEPDEDDEDEDEGEAVQKGVADQLAAVLKGQGLVLEPAVLEAVRKAFPYKEEDEDEDKPKGKKGKAAKTQKAVADAPAQPTVEEFTAQALEAFGMAIAKSGKKFTPKRTETMKEAVGKLIGLLAELTDAETVKEAFGVSGLSTSGTTTTPTPGMAQNHGTGGPGAPGNAITAKAAEPAPAAPLDIAAIINEAVTKAVAPLQETIQKQATELEEIKKSRQAPTGGGDGDPEKPTTKSKGLWSGILS